MSQQIEVYKRLNFHKSGSPTVAGTITCRAVAPSLQFGTPTYSLAGTIDGAGVSLATGYSASASNRFSAFEICADSGSTDLAGDTYEAAIHGKLTMGTTQTNASLMAGLFSLDVGTVNLSANYFALRGHLDFWGNSTISGTSFVGALSAYVENEATTTVGASQHLDGVDIYQVGGPTVNATGFNSAINIRSSAAAAAWKCGILMQPTNVEQAIKVGTAYETAGSIIDGYGISLAATYGAGSSNRTFGAEINVDMGSTDLTGDTYEGAIRGRTVIGTTQTNASLMGVVGCVDVGSSKDIQGNVFGVDAVLDFYGNSTAGSGAAFYAGAIRGTVWNEGTTTVGAGGVLAGVDLNETAAPSLGSGAVNPAVYIRGSFAQALAFKSGATCYAANTGTPAVATAWDIVVNMGGTAGYIPVYSDRTWGS